jgi:hypothetical protein
MGTDTLTASKECRRCGEIKPIDCFYKAAGGTQGVRKTCIVCIRKVERIKRTEKWMQVFTRAGGRCTKCGISEVDRPEIYDFHHTDPQIKEIAVSRLMTGPLHIIYNEADKCVLLCSNCHRTEHARIRDEHRHTSRRHL